MPVTSGRLSQGLFVQQTGMWSHMQRMKPIPVLELFRVLRQMSCLRGLAVVRKVSLDGG
jgi:hypothetical protein